MLHVGHVLGRAVQLFLAKLLAELLLVKLFLAERK